MTDPSYIGIDVGKDELIVATTSSALGAFPNDRDGHRALVDRLRSITVASVVLESTGRYGRDVAIALGEAGFAVAIVQPGCVRNYAKGMGQLAKTDAIDARMIARFGEHRRPRVWAAPKAEIARLRALVDRRDQIVEMRKAEKNRLEACVDATIADELRESIAGLERQEKAYDATIAKHLASHEHLHRLSKALQAEPGVALQTTAAVMAHLPELGCLNRQQVAALVGLAPYNRDSGRRTGTTGIAGGRRRLRRALYMAALSAVRWSQWIRSFYQHLLKRGKPKKVALIACGRKLAIRLNSIAAAALADPQPS